VSTDPALLSMDPLNVASREIRALIRCPPFDARAAVLVIEALAQGLKLGTLHASAGFPPYWVINQWRSHVPEFDDACVRASEAAAELFAAEVVTIADDTNRAPACRAVAIDARKWAVKILNRKKYDPATRIEVTPGAGRADDLSDDELAAIARRERQAGAIDAAYTDVTGEGDDVER
jgi:hypothetical protein